MVSIVFGLGRGRCPAEEEDSPEYGGGDQHLIGATFIHTWVDVVEAPYKE